MSQDIDIPDPNLIPLPPEEEPEPESSQQIPIPPSSPPPSPPRQHKRARLEQQQQQQSKHLPKPTPPPPKEEVLLAPSVDEEELMIKMGFAKFNSTKGKKVPGNDVGAVHVVKKRRYRQYMNRKGGFNRPLDKTA